jgi:hypothetical protein
MRAVSSWRVFNTAEISLNARGVVATPLCFCLAPKARDSEQSAAGRTRPAKARKLWPAEGSAPGVFLKIASAESAIHAHGVLPFPAIEPRFQRFSRA